jgi:hypothetical protein
MENSQRKCYAAANALRHRVQRVVFCHLLRRRGSMADSSSAEAPDGFRRAPKRKPSGPSGTSNNKRACVCGCAAEATRRLPVEDRTRLLACLRIFHWTRSRRSKWLRELSATEAQGLTPEYRVANEHYDASQKGRKGRRKSTPSLRYVDGAYVPVAELPPGTPLTPADGVEATPGTSAARAAVAA